MADELISFPATLAVLQQLADDVKAGYIENLVRDGHPTMYGQNRLTDTITTVVKVDDKEFTASLKMNEYWKYLEEGTKPHWPPRDAILKWVEVKPLLPRPDGHNRIPKPEQLAFLVSRKIAEKGTEGSHGFQKTREGILPFYYDRIGEALSEDIGDYIRLIFTW